MKLDMQFSVHHTDAAQVEVFVQADGKGIFVIQDLHALVPVVFGGVEHRIILIIIFIIPVQDLRHFHEAGFLTVFLEHSRDVQFGFAVHFNVCRPE